MNPLSTSKATAGHAKPRIPLAAHLPSLRRFPSAAALSKLALALALATVSLARAGTITGTVRAQGKPEAEQQAHASANYESRKFKFAERVSLRCGMP